MSLSQHRHAGYIFAGFTLMIWAGFVIASRHGGQGLLTPYDLAALRIGTAAIVLSPWWLPRLLQPSRRRVVTKHAFGLAIVVGITYPLLAYGGLSIAPASHGGILLSGMLPLFTTVMALLILKEIPSRLRLLGLGLILAGVTTLFVANLQGFGHGLAALPGDIMLLGASICWALFTVLLKRWQLRPFDVTLAIVAYSALLYLPFYALFLPKQIHLAPLNEVALQAFFQGFLVVCVAMWTYAKAAELLGAVKVVMIMSSVPVLATLLAVPLLGESLTVGSAVGALLAGLGAYIGAMAKPATLAQPLPPIQPPPATKND
ncbi:MAG: DMT family transporter [Moraxellaceae bacterium]|nr:DMT family transporter [Moraxellaceae bacterium]MDZ4386991.1 DMT family transporter [Moraxellaceae bacterium]